MQSQRKQKTLAFHNHRNITCQNSTHIPAPLIQYVDSYISFEENRKSADFHQILFVRSRGEAWFFFVNSALQHSDGAREMFEYNICLSCLSYVNKIEICRNSDLISEIKYYSNFVSGILTRQTEKNLRRKKRDKLKKKNPFLKRHSRRITYSSFGSPPRGRKEIYYFSWR